jgi:hypothetical protein
LGISGPCLGRSSSAGPARSSGQQWGQGPHGLGARRARARQPFASGATSQCALRSSCCSCRSLTTSLPLSLPHARRSFVHYAFKNPYRNARIKRNPWTRSLCCMFSLLSTATRLQLVPSWGQHPLARAGGTQPRAQAGKRRPQGGAGCSWPVGRSPCSLASGAIGERTHGGYGGCMFTTCSPRAHRVLVIVLTACSPCACPHSSGSPTQSLCNVRVGCPRPPARIVFA